jgi:L-asparaginase II
VFAALGDPHAPIYPRSASKPLQAVGMVRAGLLLDGPRLAVVCSSHSGEPIHLSAVTAILTGVGLGTDVLQTPAEWPTDDEAARDLVRAGGSASPLTMNCSGKHAGMIATAVVNGWPIHSYRQLDHPVQVAILAAINDLTSEKASSPAVDGCGAPLVAISLAGLARAFARMAVSTDPAEAAVATAIRQHPEFVSGTRREELALHRALPGVIAKAGAEAVCAIGLPDGRGVAVKISDGSPRACTVLVAAVLQQLGLDSPTLTGQASTPVLGHGEPVGEIRTIDGALSGFYRAG